MAAIAADVEDFDVETNLPRFLNSVLEKAEHHFVVVDHTVSLLRTLKDSRSIIDTADKQILGDLPSAFDDVFCAMQQCLAQVSLSPNTAAQNICPKPTSVGPGRPGCIPQRPHAEVTPRALQMYVE